MRHNVTRAFMDHALRLRQEVDTMHGGDPADSYTFYNERLVWRMGISSEGVRTIGPVALRNRLLVASGHMPTYGQRVKLASQEGEDCASRTFIAAEHSAANKPLHLNPLLRRSAAHPSWPYSARLAVMGGRDACEATELVYQELDTPSTLDSLRNQVYERAAQFMTLTIAEFVSPEDVSSVPVLEEPPNAFESRYDPY